VRDLGSTNGTAVDGVFIVEAYVVPGSRIRVGESEILFEGHESYLDVTESPRAAFGELLGESAVMRAVFGILERVAPTSLSLLLTGETGTGKDLAARAIHEASGRRDGPFVVVDCGALSRTLVESQLFGHERGAFTGADKTRKGAFERAHGGTVFLDEIGELPLDLQPKLLRVLERQEVEPLGASEPIDIDVRVVAATHRNLPDMVQRGAFRDDLFFRLAEVVIELPPLRDRREDIGMLAAQLLGRAEAARATKVGDDATAWLSQRDWPGNVRELRNVIRRAAVLAPGAVLERATLETLERMSPRSGSVPPPPRASTGEEVPLHDELPIKDAREQWMETLERRYLERLVARFGEDVGAIAAHTRLHRKSVYRLLRQHGLLDE
jgi:DNA-binding NtrC family response regulator